MDYDGEQDDLHEDEIEHDPVYLAFRVAEEHYLVPVDTIAEVIRAPKIVSVPDVPAYIPGVINLRGSVVPVVHLARRFSLQDATEAGRRVIVVVTANEELTGLMVDEVKRVISVPSDRIDSEAFVDRQQITTGVATTEHGNFLILDAARLIAGCQDPGARA